MYLGLDKARTLKKMRVRLLIVGNIGGMSLVEMMI
jgi:hypothetical protein